jgi:hypothetical protein
VQHLRGARDCSHDGGVWSRAAWSFPLIF